MIPFSQQYLDSNSLTSLDDHLFNSLTVLKALSIHPFSFISLFPSSLSGHSVKITSHLSLHPSSQITGTSFPSTIPPPFFFHRIHVVISFPFILAQTLSHHSLLHYSSTTLAWKNWLFIKLSPFQCHSTAFIQFIIHQHFLKSSHIPPLWYLLSTHTPSIPISINSSPFHQSLNVLHRPLIKLPHLPWPWKHHSFLLVCSSSHSPLLSILWWSLKP